jgi:hypothetical protein
MPPPAGTYTTAEKGPAEEPYINHLLEVAMPGKCKQLIDKHFDVHQKFVDIVG